MYVIQKYGYKEHYLKAYEEFASTGKNEEWGRVDGLLYFFQQILKYIHGLFS